MSLRSRAREWVQRLDRVLAAEREPLAPADPVDLGPIPGGPKLVQTQARDGSSKIYSVPGTLITGGFLSSLGEFNPLLMGREAMSVWEKMRRTSSQVDKTLEMCVAPIVGAKWDIVPDPDADGTESQKEEIAKAAKENLFGGLEYSINGSKHTQSWNEALRNILLMLAFGCSAFEEVFTVDGEQVRLAALADLPPKTFYQWDVEEDGRTLRALIQLGYRGQLFERLEVTAERLNVFTYRQEGADFWGRSILRAAYSHWYAVSSLYAIRNIGAERTSVGVPSITLPPNASAADRNAAVAYVTQIAAHQKTGIVLPNGATFEIVAVKGQTFNSMDDVIHHNEQISFVALDFFSNLGRGGRGGASGNRSLAQGQGKFFMLALQNTADFIAQRMTDVTLTRWTAYNYGPEAPVPLMKAANVQSRGFEEVMAILTQAAANGLVKSDKSIRDYVRTESGAPQETDEDVIAIRGETVTEGADAGGQIAGRSAATVESAPAAAGGGNDAETPKGKAAQALSETGRTEKQILRFAQNDRKGPRNDRATQSPFWKEGHDPALKMVHAREAHVDFPAHQAALDLAEQKIRQVLLRGRRKLLRQMAANAAAGKAPSQVPGPVEMKSALREQLFGLYLKARAHMRAESDRLDRKAWTLDDRTRIDGAGKSDPTPLLAQIAVDRYTGGLASGVERAASNLRAGSVTIADLPRNPDGSYNLAGLSKNELADLIWEEANGAGQQAGIPAISPNLEANIAAVAARDTFRRGRSQEAQDIIDELERAGVKAQIIRVGILDKNICGPCEAADGKPWPLDVPVSSICEGGDLCRCEPIEVRE